MEENLFSYNMRGQEAIENTAIVFAQIRTI